MSDKTDIYYSHLAHQMAQLDIDKDQNNAVFTDGKGSFNVMQFPVERFTFDDMIEHMHIFNGQEGNRCIFVTSPNRILREISNFNVKSMLTMGAPMVDKRKLNNGITHKGVVTEEYLVPEGININYMTAVVNAHAAQDPNHELKHQKAG